MPRGWRHCLFKRRVWRLLAVNKSGFCWFCGYPAKRLSCLRHKQPKGTYANFVYVLNASCAFHQRNTRI